MDLEYGNKATVNTGNYENQNPEFKFQVTNIELENSGVSFQSLVKEVDDMLRDKVAEIKLGVAPKKDPVALGHRIRDKYPSVTTIITPEMPNIPKLAEHGVAGSLFDYTCKHFANTGEIVKPTQEFYNTLKFHGMDEDFANDTFKECFMSFKKTFKDLPFDLAPNTSDVLVTNNTMKYDGEYDCLTTEGDIVDFKKTKGVEKKPEMRLKFFKQMAAYVKAMPKKDRNKVKRMWIMTPFDVFYQDDIDMCYELFKQDRKKYTEVYGI